MEQPTQFRISFSGFNREDVVHYIEYLNNKHAAQISQLKSELEQQRRKLTVSAADDSAEKQLRKYEEEIGALRLRVSELEEALAAKNDAAESGSCSGFTDVLTDIRESAGTLAVSAQLMEESDDTISEIANSLVAGLNALQSTMDSGRKAMLDARSALDNLNKN